VIKRLLSTLFLAPLLVAAASTLDIYWIDVEGGAATLLVTQAGETVLMDAGWSGFDDRDAKRIEQVLKNQVKAAKIDYFITSHFHTDHVGGLPALAKRVPIGKFVEHGESVELDNERGKQLWDAYAQAAGDKRMQVAPGEKLPLKQVEFLFVAARSKFLRKPLAGGGENPLCKNVEMKPPDTTENGKSVGFLVRVEDFEFLDLGDLSWNFEYQMACPVNLLGEVELYQVTHHGMNMSGNPAHIWAIKPRVAVMNNGPTKGGSEETFEVLAQSPGLQDLWQVHRAVKLDDAVNTDQNLIANLGETKECTGNWIKASLNGDGTYTITNGRNGFTKTYRVK
jgi:beta-lactamase superfamily II metal-dependent hydrolase